MTKVKLKDATRDLLKGAADMLSNVSSMRKNADDLAQAILHLPSRYKEVILLYYYQDMTMREVAAALGVSLSCVDKRLKSACKKLKAKLGKEDFYES